MRALAGVAVVGMSLAGCGVLPGGGGDSSAPASKLTENFRLVADDQGKRVVGHGISFVVPGDWHEEGAEEDNANSPGVREWAVEPVKAADPFAPYMNVTASAADQDKDDLDDVVEGFKAIQKLDKTTKILDEGKLDVPGSSKSYQLHLTYHERQAFGDDPTEREVDVETRLIWVSLPGGHVTTLRQISVVGHFGDVDFDAMMKSIAVHLS